jgi:hypothetical protein
MTRDRGRRILTAAQEETTMQLQRQVFLGLGFVAFLVALVVAAVLGGGEVGVGFFGLAGLWLLARSTRPRKGELPAEEPRLLLERRLAVGDIAPEDYFERDAILRTSTPAPARRRGLNART